MISAVADKIIEALNAEKSDLLKGIKLIKYGDIQPIAVSEHPAVVICADKLKVISNKLKLAAEWTLSVILYTVSAGVSDNAQSELFALLWDKDRDIGLIPALHKLTNSPVRIGGRCFFLRLSEECEFGTAQNDGYSSHGAHLTLTVHVERPILK